MHVLRGCYPLSGLWRASARQLLGRACQHPVPSPSPPWPKRSYLRHGPDRYPHPRECDAIGLAGHRSASTAVGTADAGNAATASQDEDGSESQPESAPRTWPEAASDLGGPAGPATSSGTSTSGGSSHQPPLPGGLYVIPTPIGNLGDITLRAADTLRRVSLLLAEDTRHTRKLLNHLGIRQLELLSCHEHNEKLRLAGVLQRLQAGEPVGLVSDAGMPGISDPGHRVVAAALGAGVRVEVLPGPCAFVAALVGCGLPTDCFTFAGFLPPKAGARRKALERLAGCPGTLVLYVPPHGLAAALRDCAEVLGGGRRCCVAREVSKLHEEYFRSTLEGTLHEFTQVREPRGEICLLIEGAGEGGAGVGSAAAGGGSAAGAGAVERVLRELLAGGMPVSAAVKEVVASLGAPKKAAYAAALRISDSLGREGAGS